MFARLIPPCRRTALILAGSIAALLGSESAQAVTRTWAPGTTDFNLGTNWNGGLPGTGDDALFNGTAGPQPNVTANIPINPLNFSATAANFLLSSTNASTKLTLLSTGVGTTTGTAAIV